MDHMDQTYIDRTDVESRWSLTSADHALVVAKSQDNRLSFAALLLFFRNHGRLPRMNVIEQWNGANDFVFFARRGELVSNRHEDHEVSMLALHLLQNCMVYINTLMLQQVLAQPKLADKLTRET